MDLALNINRLEPTQNKVKSEALFFAFLRTNIQSEWLNPNQISSPISAEICPLN